MCVTPPPPLPQEVAGEIRSTLLPRRLTAFPPPAHMKKSVDLDFWVAPPLLSSCQKSDGGNGRGGIKAFVPPSFFCSVLWERQVGGKRKRGQKKAENKGKGESKGSKKKKRTFFFF